MRSTRFSISTKSASSISLPRSASSPWVSYEADKRTMKSCDMQQLLETYQTVTV
jgi:hypothetical protein